MSDDELPMPPVPSISGFASQAQHGVQNVVQRALSNKEVPVGVGLIAGIMGLLGGFFLFAALFSLCTLNWLAPLAAPPAQTAPYSGPVGAGGGPGGTIPGYPTPTPTNPLVGNLGDTLQSAVTVALSEFILLIILLTALGIGHIVLARGLYLLKPWGFWGTVGLEGLNVVASFIGFISSHNGIQLFAQSFIAVLVLLYMFSVPSVRQTFRPF